MKNLSLNLRRVRSTVRTDVNTGVSIRKQQGGCALPTCVYGSQNTGIVQAPAGDLRIG
ncbi:MAG: hypothetical protein U0174_15410 [Polyangiaceae bacterium]